MQRRKILDLGCSTGKDLVTFLRDREDIEIVGLDLRDYGLRQSNFHMVLGDAVEIPFPNSYFDVTVSIGVLEHIKPIEKLANVINEINRVSKSYAVVVPSVSSVIEPHFARVFWQLRDRSRKPVYPGTLIYMSDEAWLSFKGFKDAESRRFWHVPPFVSNLLIHRGERRI
jgi:ubiquinone/menaquinone biosynthesis C-methylase UbiE